jgi:hypothetical protein
VQVCIRDVDRDGSWDGLIKVCRHGAGIVEAGWVDEANCPKDGEEAGVDA